MTIVPDYYVPNQLIIRNIFPSFPITGFLTVLTIGNHGLNIGAIVRFLIPSSRGAKQLNGQTAVVIFGQLDTLVFDIEPTAIDPFVPLIPPDPKLYAELPQLSVIAEDALTLDYAIHNNNNIIPEIFGPVPNNPRVTL